MTASFATPRIELLDGLIAAGLEVDRLLGQLRSLGRRLVGARRYLARGVVRNPLGYAYIHRIEGESGEVMGQLAAARLQAQALCRVDSLFADRPDAPPALRLAGPGVPGRHCSMLR